MISLYTLNESTRWDEIVKSFRGYDVYYLSDYTKAFNSHGDGEPILIYYESPVLRAINVVMMRDIEADKRFRSKIQSGHYYDIVTPYGYGGFLFEGDPSVGNLEQLEQAYSEFCRSKNIVSEFVRFHPLQQNAELNRTLYEVIDLGKTVTLKLGSRQQIWADLSSKNRNVIRKAIKSEVKVYWGMSPNLVEAFIPLYNATMSKDDASDYYYFNQEFYESILKDLKYNCLFFYAVYETKIISMSMILFGNKQMHYHLSASDREFQNLAATNLLLFEAACWGCANGYQLFHLGGGLGSKEDSLFKFKEAFNKNTETHFSIGKKIFDPMKYHELVELSVLADEGSVDSTFFPAYRK